jgi:hypothetical protein
MKWWVSDNNKVGVFAYAKDFSALLEMTKGQRSLARNDGRVVWK